MLIVIIFLNIACSQEKSREDEKAPVTKVKEIQYENIKDTLTIYLETILDTIYCAPLEQYKGFSLNEKTLDIVLDDENIVVATMVDVHHFNHSGKHIKKLLDRGRGPNEFLSIGSPQIYNGCFYYADGRNSENIIKIDLDKKVVSKMKSNVNDLDQFLVLKDSMIYISRSISVEKGGNKKIVFLNNQDTVFNHDKTLTWFHGGKLFFDNKGAVFYSRGDGDIWEINNGQVELTWQIKLNYVPESIFEKKPYTILETIKCHEDYLLLLSRDFYKTNKGGWRTNLRLLYLSKDLQNAGEVVQFKYKGEKIPNYRTIHYKSSNYLLFEVSAFQLLDYMKNCDTLNVNSYLIKSFSKICQNGLTENDNPILLIGKYKK
ncbi:MAG: hypothetical protein MI784_15300 [Cytophagales bacterium]|nr:hypothetical protein [Cytophagales bacterium]